MKATVQLGGVVVSASRRVEKVTDAPAQVTTIDALALSQTIGNSFAPALKSVPGLDYIQVGITAAAVNARGFNSSFNNRMLQTEDGRIATLPESGLPLGVFTTIPRVDLASVEILTGPGAALYGPDASNGVITLSTKDAKQYQGYTFEASAGSRDFYDVQARYAGVTGKFGYKMAAETQAAHDFESRPSYPVTGKGAQQELSTNYTTTVQRANGALSYYLDNGSRIVFDAGASRNNGIGQTNLGRNQLVNYDERHIQLKFTGARWFAQVYETTSGSGKTYQLNAFTTNTLTNPALTADSAKALSSFPGEGRVYAAELQNNFTIGMLTKTGVDALDNTRITYGGQYRRDRVSSYMHWLSDRKSGTALTPDQKGGYVQIETPMTSQLRMVLAGRYDKPTSYDAQFSPKAALLY
jgi:outer membrane receptor for ferrienterochelin and colicins